MTKVFSLNQLPEGHMHQVKLGDYDVLLANVKGQVFAVENKCSHYGFALTKGSLCEHRVRCPLHHASFDVRTGEQLEAPGMDGLASFRVETRNGDIFLSEQPVATNQPEPVTGDLNHNLTNYDYVIVGGGPAAAYAVESIRKRDQNGSVVVFTQETMPPYDRTKVSKGYLQGDADRAGLPLRSLDFYRDLNVEFRAGTQVQSVDVKAKSVTLAGGESLSYERILLATGGTPRELKIPGYDLKGVHVIRKVEDATAAIEATTEGKQAVIVGGSFIGLECAMSLAKQGAEITVVTPEEILFEKVFGERVGKYVRKLHEDAGVSFQFGRKAEKISGKDRVASVTLDNGTELPADLVIVGIGVEPATDYVKGIALQDDGSIAVDGHLAAHAENLWVAGDIATYPDREGMLRIEHWKVAAQQGRVAGINMAGGSEPYTMLPFFWTNQQGINFRYVGHATDYDDIVFDGEPGESPFLAFYLKGERVQAVLGVKRDADAAAINELMALGAMPAAGNLKGNDWLQLARDIAKE